MKPGEAKGFVDLVKQFVPKQELAEFSVEAWEMALSDLPLADCMQALKQKVHRVVDEGRDRGPWITYQDIRREAKRIRTKRLENVDKTFIDSSWYPKEVEGESEASYAARTIMAKRAYMKAVADGEAEPAPPMLEPRFNPDELMRGVFRDAPPISSLPARRVGLSPRAKALMRSRIDRDTGSSPTEVG